MTPSFIPHDQMRLIRSWDFAIPFADSLVAYKSNSTCFEPDKGFTFDSKSKLKFGYIESEVKKWDCGEKGYNMSRLLKTSETPGFCALIDSKLRYSISMRGATIDEALEIGRIINTDQAKFEHNNDKQRINLIIERHIQTLRHSKL